MAITYELVAADWTVDSQTGNIRYGGHDHNGASPSYATVIELHRWLQGLADDQEPASTNDEVYIAMLNPSVRSTDNIITLINGYNIDAAAAEHLYDGSIIQNDGAEIWDGIVNFGNADVQLQIIQDGAIISDDFWNYNLGGTATGGSTTTLVDTGAFAGMSLVGYSVVNTHGGVRDGSRGIVLSHTDDTLTFASGELHGGSSAEGFSTSDTYLIGKPLCPNSTQGISHRFLVKVREDDCDIDGRRLIGICRRMGNTYSEFRINGTSRGNNVLALVDTGDLNCTTGNTTVIGTTWDTDFSGEDLGFEQFDVDDNGTNEDYFGKLTWINTHDINDLYERAKGETEDGSGYTVHGLSGEVFRGVTHSVGYDTEAGGISISDYDMLVWGTYVDHGSVTSGPFTLGEAVHENSATPAWKGRILSIDVTDLSLIVDVTEGTVGNTETFVGQSSGASAVTSSAPSAVTGGGVLHVLAHDATNDYLYVQVIRGTMAADQALCHYGGTDLTAADHTDSVTIEVGVLALTQRTISTPYIGVSTGTAIIGGYGVGIDNAKLTSADKVFDLTDTQITPPNTVTNTVSGVVVGQDYVFVAPWDGTTVDINGDPTMGRAHFTLASDLTSGTTTSVAVNEDLADADIDAYLASSGYIDILKDDGSLVTVAYSTYDTGGDTFTITSTDFSGGNQASAGNYCYVGQMHLTTALSGAAESSIVVNAIPGSSPNSGTLRVINDEGFHIRVNYSSYDDPTDTFTLVGADTFVDANVDTGTEEIEITGHLFKDQMPVTLTTTGTLPSPLALATTYYVIYSDADNIKLAASLEDAANGTAVNITTAAGGGTHTITPDNIAFNGSGLTDTAAIGNTVYLTYIDLLAKATSLEFQAVYDNALDLTLLVRDGGTTPIKQFISEWSFGNSNQSISAIRTSDT
jgi:hypothetical protein